MRCSEKTIDNWKKKPEFLAAIERAEDDIYKDALRLLKRSAKANIVTLLSCTDSKMPPHCRVSAASKLLELAFEVNTSQIVTARLDALEEVARSIPHE